MRQPRRADICAWSNSLAGSVFFQRRAHRESDDVAERLAGVGIGDRQAVRLQLDRDQAEGAAVAVPAVDAEIETIVAPQAQAVRPPDQAHTLQRDGLVE